MKVFICFTPLHVLISQRIIKKENIKKYIFIFMIDNDNKKNQYYYNRLSANATYSSYIILKKAFLSDIKKIYLVSTKIKKYKDLVYYSGKIKSSHNRLLMYLTDYKNFITFDDGSGNISGDGYFYNPDESLVFKIFFKLFDKKLLYSNILIDNHLHYTIFNQDNVYKNTFFIDLFNKNKNSNIKKNNKMVVLLTNAFSEDGEMSLNEEETLYARIIKKFDVSYFIKHPRQKKDKVCNDSIKELKSDKISEELLIELSHSYDLTVIGIYSTVLINLSSLKNIKLINIKVNLKKPVKQLDKILEENSIENKIF